jgi:hypothetical protein
MERQLKLGGVGARIYCIDTSALFNLKPYFKDIFPSLWKKLDDMVKKRELISPKEAQNEVNRGKDQISEWCSKNRSLFIDVNDCQQQEIRNIEAKYTRDTWIRETSKPGYWADPWVFALSICEEATIVADEANRQDKIPNIAAALNIRCISLYELFKEIGIRL